MVKVSHYPHVMGQGVVGRPLPQNHICLLLATLCVKMTLSKRRGRTRSGDVMLIQIWVLMKILMIWSKRLMALIFPYEHAVIVPVHLRELPASYGHAVRRLAISLKTSWNKNSQSMILMGVTS